MSRTHATASSPRTFDRPPGGDDLTLAGILSFALRHRRVILTTGLVLFLVVSVVTFVRHRTYTSTAMFMPQATEGALSRLSGLAASFGVTVPGTDPGSSPDFYADLLKSRDVLRRTVETRYAFATPGDSVQGTLVELFKARGKTPAARRDNAAKKLLKSIDVGIGRETGTVELEVTTRWADLSRQVGDRMIQLVSDFNLHRLQTKAGAERRFVEARLAEARDTLRAAESRLQTFLQRNREYRDSPQLTFEFDRREREVLMRQQVYTTLAQSYEAARIDEVRNTPVITLIEAPDLPSKPDPRLALVKGLLAGLLGLVLGAFIAGLREAFGGFRMGRPAPAGGPGASGPEEPSRRPLVSTAAGPDAQ
jgi:uncharacterized protein involved in exopolysaccharide biosynthesis